MPRSETYDRFQREIRLLRELRHQHVVRAIDSGVWRGVPFVVMEFLDGIDLDRLVRTGGPLAVPDAMEVGRQIAVGLRYVHDLKLVHRDVKPSNAILTKDRVCLLDLGLARVVETDWDVTGPTLTGEALGTLRYAAPEQLGQAHEVDARADLYGLGATLLWLVTGKPPFSDATPRDFWRFKLGVSDARDSTLEEFAATTDANVIGLLRRLLAPDPQDRPCSVSDVLCDLERLSAGHRLDELSRNQATRSSKENADGPEHAISVVITVLEDEPGDGRLSRLRILQAVAILGSILIAIALPFAFSGGSAKRINPPTVVSWRKSNRDTSDHYEAAKTTSSLSAQALVPEPVRLEGVDSWTIETLQPRGHLYEVAFSADRGRYATGDDAGVVRVFDSETNYLRQTFIVGSRIRSLDWSSSEGWLAIGCSEPEVVVFDTDSGQRVAHLKLEFGIAHCVRWHPRLKQIAAAGGKGYLIHDLSTSLSREFIVSDSDGVNSLSWSPDGASMLTGDGKGRLRIWNASDGKLSREFLTPKSRIIQVAWSPDGKAVSFATTRGQVEVRTTTSSEAWSLEGHLPQAIHLESLWRNASTLLTNDGVTLRWFEIPNSEKSPQGLVKVTNTSDSPPAGTLSPIRTHLNPLRLSRQAHGGGVLHRLAISRDGREAICALRFSRRVWRLDLIAGTDRLLGPNDPATGFDSRVSWSPQGRWIAVGQQMRGVRVLDAKTLEPRHSIPITDVLGSLSWSPDDEQLAVIGGGQISVYSKLTSPQFERKALPPCGSVTCSWSPDGQLLATSGWGEKRMHLLRLLDTTTWSASVQTPLAGDAYLIQAWSPDQKSLAIGTDQDVLIFDVASRVWKKEFPLGNRVNGLSWHPSPDYSWGSNVPGWAGCRCPVSGSRNSILTRLGSRGAPAPYPQPRCVAFV